jgi:ribose 5-phosphate isomerase B
MRIALGSDHAGHTLRLAIDAHLRQAGHEVLDLGTQTTESVDYPRFATAVAETVTRGDAALGVLVCGTGLGMSMAANRFPGIRAALCTDSYTASMARAHNDANVLCLGERVVGSGVAISAVDAFVNGAFAGGRHAERVAQLTALEKHP